METPTEAVAAAVAAAELETGLAMEVERGPVLAEEAPAVKVLREAAPVLTGVETAPGVVVFDPSP